MKLNNETKIGILVVVVLMILAVITWKTGDFNFAPDGYMVKVHFQNIEGVELNAPVTLNGLEVGRVRDIRIIYGDTTIVELTLWLKASARLHKGAKAYVKNMGFLGEKYVGLTTGVDREAFLPPGSIIQGKEPPSLEEILAEGEVIAANIKEITEELNERLQVNSESIDAIVADMRVTMKNVSSISDNVYERLRINEDRIDEMVVNLNASSKNLEELSYDLKENPWKLLYRPKKKREDKKK
jgi:phospholipid/cholesterol/gamma-HCH transport system substrate-binding protein